MPITIFSLTAVVSAGQELVLPVIDLIITISNKANAYLIPSAPSVGVVAVIFDD